MSNETGIQAFQPCNNSMTSIELFEMMGDKYGHKREIHRAIKNMFSGKEIDGVIITQSLNPNKTVGFYVLNELATKMFVASKDIHYLSKITQYWINKNTVKTLSPMEMVIQSAQAIIKIEEEQLKQSQRLSVIEEKQDSMNGDTKYLTVTAYCRLTRPRSLRESNSLGKAAAKMCKRNNIPVGSVPDERWGQVNSYPRYVFDELIGEI